MEWNNRTDRHQLKGVGKKLSPKHTHGNTKRKTILSLQEPLDRKKEKVNIGSRQI